MIGHCVTVAAGLRKKVPQDLERSPDRKSSRKQCHPAAFTSDFTRSGGTSSDLTGTGGVFFVAVRSPEPLPELKTKVRWTMMLSRTV